MEPPKTNLGMGLIQWMTDLANQQSAMLSGAFSTLLGIESSLDFQHRLLTGIVLEKTEDPVPDIPKIADGTNDLPIPAALLESMLPALEQLNARLIRLQEDVNEISIKICGDEKRLPVRYNDSAETRGTTH